MNIDTITASLLLGVCCLAQALQTCSSTVPPHRYQLDPFPFEYGVTSADPLEDAVLLWTRATNFTSVTWSIWIPGTGSFENNVTSGVATTSAELDFIVQVDATGLPPKTRLEYAFEAGGFRSRIGRTKTAPALNDTSVASMRVATLSCACHWCGYMNSYREIAEDASLDLVLALGDWLYTPPGTGCGRVPAGMCHQSKCELTDVAGFPAQENCDANDIHRVEDMRYYHKTISLDVDARAMRAAHAMINIPDNHDINDVITTNLTATPELIAWLEWVPTRYSVDQFGTLFFPRRFRYGQLLDIVRLDTRNIGRFEAPPSYLGQDQIDFLENEVFGPTKTDGWRMILTSQVFMPWTIQEVGYLSVMYGVLMAVVGPLFIGLTACCFVRVRRRQKQLKGEDEKAGAKVAHYSTSLDESSDKEPAYKRYCRKVGPCCLSNACMGVTLFLIIALFAASGAAVIFIRDYMERKGISSNASGIANIQSGRDRAWDGENNPTDRSALLAQMKRLGAKNNLFITGDMHMSLANDVYDTAPGIGPPGDIPSETTYFGVEFLSSSVSRSNLDERMRREFGDWVVPPVKFLFESAFYISNPHFRFFESVEHGYGIVVITPQKTTFQWRWVRHDIPLARSTLAKTMSVNKDANRFS